MGTRFIRIVGMTAEGFPEIEEEVDAIQIFAFEFGPLPLHLVSMTERRRRVVTDPDEIAALPAGEIEKGAGRP